MKVVTRSILPAPVRRYFDRLLLRTPPPKFGQDSEDLENIIFFIEHRLLKKLRHNSVKYEKYKGKLEQAKALLQTVKAQEDEIKRKNSKALAFTGYYFRLTPARHKKVLGRPFFWADWRLWSKANSYKQRFHHQNAQI